MKKLLFILFLTLISAYSAHAQLLRFGMVNQDPDPVLAGDVVELRFKVENPWEDSREDVIVEIAPEYPFSIYSSSPTKNLGKVRGRNYAEFFDFKLKVDPDAVDGDHEIILNIHQGSSEYKLENMFSIDVKNEKIALKPYIIASDFITAGTSGSFTIEIANTGGEDVESLELELLPSQEYKLLSTSNYVYIGNLEADDTESEDFKIYIPEGATIVHVPLKLLYEVNDKDYEQTFELSVNLLTEKEAKKIGLLKQNYTLYIVTTSIVLILTILIVKRVRKRR